MKKLRRKRIAEAIELKKSIKEKERRRVGEPKLRPERKRLAELLEEVDELKTKRCINFLIRDTQLNMCATNTKITKALKKKKPG